MSHLRVSCFKGVVIAGVVVLVIKPVTMTLPHCLSWLLKLPIISCPLNIASFFSIAVLKVLFFLIHTYQHFICILRLILIVTCPRVALLI